MIMRIAMFLAALLALLLAGSWVATRVIAARMQAKYPPIGTSVSIDGRRVQLVDRGPKAAPARQTIVMIHGASSNLRDMVFAFDKRLPADLRLFAIDRPGHGYSERRDMRADANLDLQAQLIADAMSAQGIKRAVILAHSFGGALALRFALNHPDRVAALILIAPVSHAWPGGIAWYYSVTNTPLIGPVFANTLAPLAGYFTIDSAIDGVFKPAAPPEGYRDGIGAGLVLRPGNFEANAVDVASLLPQVVAQSGRYAEIMVPVLIFASDVDTVVSPTIHAATLAAQVPHGRLMVIHGGGHAPHHSKPEIIIPAILNFLRSLPTDVAQ
jgi:pimeloyl-ACP methyl ester carboxylesterase